MIDTIQGIVWFAVLLIISTGGLVFSLIAAKYLLSSEQMDKWE